MAGEGLDVRPSPVPPLTSMNPTNPNRKAAMTHPLICVVTKDPGKTASIKVVYASNLTRMVGGPLITLPYEAGSTLQYVCNRERGLAGPVVVCTVAEGGFASTPAAQLERVKARLDAGQW